MNSATNNWSMDMKADNCGVFVDAYLAEYAFSRCHILSSSDNLAIWSIPINMPVPLNWPPPDYLKGEPNMLPLPPSGQPNNGFNNTFGRYGATFNVPYVCPCMIITNNYSNACNIIHNLK